MTLTGPVVLDIAQHFTERWNEIKKRKVSGYIHSRPYIRSSRLSTLTVP
jgi:hypothetical protein